MKLQSSSSGTHETTAASCRRFNPQPSIPRFFVAGDMIRPMPLEGVVPHRRAGERPAGPLFEPRVAKPVESSVKASSKPAQETSPKANPFASPTARANKSSLLSRLVSRIATLFKRQTATSAGSTGAVQPELRLDAVKPLRHELPDSDSEPAETPLAPFVMVPATEKIILPEPPLIIRETPVRQVSLNVEPVAKT